MKTLDELIEDLQNNEEVKKQVDAYFLKYYGSEEKRREAIERVLKELQEITDEAHNVKP